MKYKLKMNREQVLEKAVWAVDYAKKHGVQVEFSAEDATRSETGFMKEVFGAVSECGADRLDIPDTVGYSTPDYISRLVTDVTTISPLPISMHCHDDLGLAVANTISWDKCRSDMRSSNRKRNWRESWKRITGRGRHGVTMPIQKITWNKDGVTVPRLQNSFQMQWE